MLPHTRFDSPLLNDVSDFSRYPMFKTRPAKLATSPVEKLYEPRHRIRGRVALFACSGRGSPGRMQCSRNVSEPQLVTSTNYMRESWFSNVTSMPTVGDIAHLSGDDDIFAVVRNDDQSTTNTCDTPVTCDADDDQAQKTSCTMCSEDSEDIEQNEYKSEEDSFYSMDSADQDAHPLLLSMPIIPQIKLQRKATVRNPDPVPSSDAVQDQSFLSPRIRDLRTPVRMSSRRYGRILARTSPLVAISDTTLDKNHDDGALSFEVSRQSGTEVAYTRSASEPVLNTVYSSDDEEDPLLGKGIDESPHSDVLLSMIDEVGVCPVPCSDRPESCVDGLPIPKQVPPGHPKRTHRRYSISLSDIVHGCASLDLLRRSKSRLKSTTKPKPDERIPNAYDPTSKWAPKQGQIVIKVLVPSTDDIWMLRVPQDINLVDFTSKVVTKLGFSVFFSGSPWDEPRYYFRTDERFKSWVKGRIRFGRNLPIVAHVLAPPPLVKLSVNGDCEVWCYA